MCVVFRQTNVSRKNRCVQLLTLFLLGTIDICTPSSLSFVDGGRGVGRTGSGAVSFFAKPKGTV